ncbi:S26 family signal peptidase [Nonomuraea sp. NPDC050556]|uniref:S26 family signal peptidase n=1 Tax=Nonomuraea sp. NPDC050556 TaxID=3364369 RepID=UPI00379EE77D
MIIVVVLAAVGGAVGVVAWLRRTYVVVTVAGSSMLPAYRPGDRVLVRRGRVDRVARRQVAVFAPGPHIALTDGSGLLVKRVVAVAGDAHEGVVVPEGCLVVLGDNPEGSLDSRVFGYVTAEHFLGTVVRTLKGAVHGLG